MRTAILIFLVAVMATAAWGQSNIPSSCVNISAGTNSLHISPHEIIAQFITRAEQTMKTEHPWKLQHAINDLLAIVKQQDRLIAELEKKIEALKVRESPNPFILPYSPVVTNAFPYNGDMLLPLINRQGVTIYIHIPSNMFGGNIVNTTEAK